MATVAAGCAMPAPESSFDAEEPEACTRAIANAAAEEDRSAIRDLIATLDSGDPAQRLLAISALQKMTGETLGYEHAASPAEREAAIERWVAWHAAQGGESIEARGRDPAASVSERSQPYNPPLQGSGQQGRKGGGKPPMQREHTGT